MKIDSKMATYEIAKYQSNKTQAAAEGQRSPQKAGTEKVDSGTGDAVVHLSHASKEAQLADRIIAEAPGSRDAKVAEIKARIESGDYKIEHEKIAAKMIEQDIEEVF